MSAQVMAPKTLKNLQFTLCEAVRLEKAEEKTLQR